MRFFSRVGQDQYLLENFFRGKRDGVFVDVGAYDGETLSNTLFFEQYMGWNGLCIEPRPAAFEKLCARRKAQCERTAVSDFEGEAEFIEATEGRGTDDKMLSGLSSSLDPQRQERLKISGARALRHSVHVTTLSALLEKHRLFHVDYCSIDTGGAELPILRELDVDRFHISVFTIGVKFQDDRIVRLMQDKGYDLVSWLQQDLVFKRRGLTQLPRTSVFCAVWHNDPRRGELLRGHVSNLARQSVPVESIYVFDGGDEPPPWLESRVVVVREKLTVYQAWNVALSLVATPVVMNLNLDDRLAPDAVEVLQNALLRLGAVAVGADWKICYSQEETDLVVPCYAADCLPMIRDWPPRHGTVTRLGSGTGDRGTYGPATMWRMDAHMTVPRYPWRTPDGTLLRSAADAAWWTVLKRNPDTKLVRVPTVIGNYHSHPADQAEFRAPYDEKVLIQQNGVSLL